MQTPSRLGYRMPAEWEPHDATWLAWPRNPETWPGCLEAVPPIWAAMIAALVEGEDVCLLVEDEAMEAQARATLTAHSVPLKRVRFHQIPTNDAWIRDYGPNFLVRPDGLALNDWGFNMWGEKYPPWDKDDATPKRIAQLLDVPRFEPGLILEGGSIDGNGRGTLLTTESCLLHPKRNPHLDREGIETALKAYLGVSHTLWLGEGIVGDDTDGHVDDLTRFVNPTTLVTVVEDDPLEDNYRPLQENLRRLETVRDQDGRPLRVRTLPMPEPIEYEGMRLPVSYANFYIANACVLLPVFGQERDRAAVETLGALFPGRQIVEIPAVELAVGLGACHCVTQQQPSVSRRVA